ncbi:MAG: DUF6647 family protein [Burkholderiaceae bacterium]
MDALLTSLLIWIGSHSAFDISRVPMPAVIEMTPLQITRQVHRLAGRRAVPAQADARLFGAYDPAAGAHGTIYVVQAVLAPFADDYPDRLANPYFHERVLHELVHHVQKHTDALTRLPCAAAAEHDAYRLAGIFIRERQLRDPIAHRPSLLRMLQGC